MANVYSVLYTALATLGYDVREQGGYAEDEGLPATFITYQSIADVDISHSDNVPTSHTSRVQVALYSTDPAMTQAARATLWTPLKAAGFMRIDGRALPYDKETGHYGYVCDFRLYQEEE